MDSNNYLNRQSRRQKEFIIGSGASVQMMSKTDLTPEEVETIRVSRLPTTVITANESIDTTEEAKVYVKDLDLFTYGPTS